MKAIIDIGSNSVRLAVFEDGQIVFKGKITSQLGRGMALSGRIDDEHREKTVAAIATLVEKAMAYGVQKKDVFLFATAAARRAANAKAFLDEVLAVTGLAVDVVSEKDEAELALSGALGEADGAVLDIGGASAELIVRSGGATVYKQSLPLGAVVLSDAFGKDSEAMKRFVDEQVKKYGDPPAIDRLIGVGGTASCLARVVALSQGRAYSGGDEVKLGDLDELCLKFFTL
ncbi:MAG: hypothetical protein ILP02_00255, partial [Clostridia bacterium]|nr:hypothetical protein [Clostridia bacterium]